MSFNVYMVDFLGVSRGIFVQTDECGRDSGHLYQVIGDMQNGMIHAHKEIKRPSNSSRFIGTVSTSQYSQVRAICDSITAGPPKIDPVNSLRHYQEWTNNVVEMLFARGVLQTPNPLSMPTQFQHASRRVDQCCSPINDSRSFDWLSASRMQAPGMAM
ncbi:4583b6aa-05a9-426b-b377-8bfd89c9e3a6 [Sclerotinia trifoliorum]|uniref:4583b6aa-05a9-426b-b377-8bfd89c9e3a6 n=1 Tax=Sclerotinia trifoliorum TaxID=28548 RepID=A0A8H2W239_9HELO|nr:4583b6aa-05a9-426b-b377-8bfd89c9e3a6 [Sclerotinia trifoliorum]